MPVDIAARLAESATNGAIKALNKPFEFMRSISMAAANTLLDVGGYHVISIGTVEFRTGDGGIKPDVKYVNVTANNNIAVVDRCADALMQQSRAGHVATCPLQEPMTVFKVTCPIQTGQIPIASTNYVTTSTSLPNMLRVEYDDAPPGALCPRQCPCPPISMPFGLELNRKKRTPVFIGCPDDDPWPTGLDPILGNIPARVPDQLPPPPEESEFETVEPTGRVYRNEDLPELYDPGDEYLLPNSDDQHSARFDTPNVSDHECEDSPHSQTTRREAAEGFVWSPGTPATVEPQQLYRTYATGPGFPEISRRIMGPEDFERKSKSLAQALKYKEDMPRDDVGAVSNEVLAGELGCSTDVIDQVVWSSQGSHELRFERIVYGTLVTIRIKYNNEAFFGPEFICTEYNKEAARNVIRPLIRGDSSTSDCLRNTLGIFNDLFPREKFSFSHERTGPPHKSTFHAKIEFRVFSAIGHASTLQQAKTIAMGILLADMLVPTDEQLEHSIIMTNKEKKVFRAYECIGQYKPDHELLRKVTDKLRILRMSTKELARSLGVTTKAINQVCYCHTERFRKTCSGWDLVGGGSSPIFKKVFGRSATATVLGTVTELREIVEFHIQVPARYADLALSMTAGNVGVTNMTYISTRFRSVLNDDQDIPSQEVDIYTNALTLLAFMTRNASTIPYGNVLVDHKGISNIDVDSSLTVDEKFEALKSEKYPRGDMYTLASFDATNFTGDYDGVRTVVYKNPNSTKDIDKPYAQYKAIQVAPNYFGLPGPVDTTSPATWFSALMRNMSDGTKELCAGVQTVISKHALIGKAKDNYLIANKIISYGDVALFAQLVKAGKIGSDCQTPPSRFTPQQSADLYSVYSDWYDRVGPKRRNHRMYVTLGIIEKARPEMMATFVKGGEVDESGRARFIQPTRQNEGHTVCNGNVVKVAAETVKLSRGSNLFKGITDTGKKFYFGKFRELAFTLGALLFCFDRSKQDWLTSLLFLENYEDYMDLFSTEMVRCGFDKIANTMYSSKNKDTKCTSDEFVMHTEHEWAMLTSACAQTSDGNRQKTEKEFLAYLLDIGWTQAEVQEVFDSWNNPEHYDVLYDEDGNQVLVPNEKMIFPMKYEGDDVTIMDKYGVFEKNHIAHCVKFAAFNSKYSTSWIPSSAAHEHGPLSPIDTLSVLFFSDSNRAKHDNCTKLASGRPDFAIPHPVKKAQSLVTMWSPANIKFRHNEDGTESAILSDPTRVAIATAKTSQAETMRDLFWLRRTATKYGEYFLMDCEDTSYISKAGPIWDPRDPEARGLAPTYDKPVVQRLVEVDKSMPSVDSRELLIANAQAWLLTCPDLRGTSVMIIAKELAVLDTLADEAIVSKDDFDIRNSYQSVHSVAPNIARVCAKKIGKTVTRLEHLGGEGTKQRLEQQKAAVEQLLSVGDKRRENEAVTNEQSAQRPGPNQWKNWNQSRHQRRSASDPAGSSGDRARGGDSSSWRKW